MIEKICAVVVTYNRKALLEQCLHALVAQSQSLSEIIVVDNASTDGTAELFDGTPPRYAAHLRYVRLPENGGGAGGFHAGMEQAMQGECEWLWLMDDDTIPTRDALAALIEAADSFPADERPLVLASRVDWTDGTLHEMNFPFIRRATADPERALLAAAHKTLWIRFASFVSVLIHRSAIERYGLPFRDYFIWNDDTEYTARVLRREFGVLVPGSVVVHKTPQKHNAMNASAARSYYQARNVLWMTLCSSAWTTEEKLKMAFLHVTWILRFLWRSKFSPPHVSAVLRGLKDGILRRPSE